MLEKCISCGVKVLFKANGKCPSCGTIVDSEFKKTNPQQAKRPTENTTKKKLALVILKIGAMLCCVLIVICLAPFVVFFSPIIIIFFLFSATDGRKWRYIIF